MELKLKLSGSKELPLYFGTWSLSRFCELNGDLSFTQMRKLFATEIAFKHIISLFLCGAEHYARKNKLPFDYTDVDAADWLDEIGGMTGKQFPEVMTVIAKVINPSYQGVELKKAEGEEKKSEEILAGSSSEPIVSGQA